VTAIWHPVSYETFSQAVNFEMMFSTLVDRCWKADDTFEFCGDLAESWETADAKTWTIKLKPGTKWHDGTPFTANDVLWTINESQKWSPGKYKNDAWDAVMGGKAAREAFSASGAEPNVAGAKVIDDNTIEITLEAPNSNWLFDVAEPDAAVMPQHILKDLLQGVPYDKVRNTIETSEFATTKPIGTGPYKFIKYETDQYTEFVADPEFHLGAPKIAKIFIKRLAEDAAIAAGEAGELDLSIRLNPAEKERLSKVPTLDVLSSTGVSTFGPAFNLTSKCDVDCRKAVAYGVNAQGIIDQIYKGEGKLNYGVNPGMPAADDQELFKYDLAKAKEHLAKSSWDKSQPLRIVFDNSFAGVLLWTPVMQQNLEEVGFIVELNGLETTAAIAAYNELDSWEMLIMQGGDQGLGPFKQASYYQCDIKVPPAQAYWNAVPRDCPNIDDKFDQAATEPDEARRTQLYKEISSHTNKLVDKVSFWTLNAMSFKTKSLQGVLVPKNTREFIIGVQNWYFSE